MDEPLHAHLRQPVLKILHSHGITRASSVSLQVLSSLLDKYMKGVLLSCQEYANHAGRNGLRVQDMMQSLEEMGCTLEDLEDYLQIEGGVRKEKEKPGYNNEEHMGLQRYANVVGPRKEAELTEFKESLRLGLVAPEDRYSERLRYTRLPTPDLAELDHTNPYAAMGYSSSEDEDEPSSDHPPIQLPLSPISNSPPHGRAAAMEGDNIPVVVDSDSVIPSFFPSLPQILPETTTGDSVADAEKEEEERKREAELLKEKETLEQQAKDKEEGDDTPAVQSFPANYIVPAPYDVSKLQSRGTWHLPSLSMSTLEESEDSAFASFSSSSPLKASNPGLPAGPLMKPYVRGDSTTEELLTALHTLTPGSQTDPNNPVTPSSLVASTAAVNAISTNPLRHKVSLVFLGTTPSRYNTPDTLFGFTPSYSVTPRPAGPLPTYVNVLEVQPGRGDKAGLKGKKDTGDLPVPPPQGRNVGVPASVAGAVTGTTSRIPAIGKRVLAKPTLARTKRLVPPPPQKRDDKLLLYHTPKPPLLAHWNMAVSGSNSQYSGALDHAKAAAEHAKASKEKNPYGVAEATLAYTWDWNAKQPWEGLEWVRGGAAFAPPPPVSVPVASASTPGGSGAPGSAIRTVPKISVNFPGRRSSTLSALTPTTGAAGGSGLIARLPGLAERSPSHLSSSTNAPVVNAHMNIEGSMAPPPVPRTSVPPSNQEGVSTMAVDSISRSDRDLKDEDEKEDVMMMMESVLGPDPIVQTPVDDMDLDSAISQLVGDGPSFSLPDESDFVRDMGLDGSEHESRRAFNPPAITVRDQELDGEIDKELADVLGEADGEADDLDVDVDVDADIAEALGSVDNVGFSRPAEATPPPPNSFEGPQLDLELAGLFGEPIMPFQSPPQAYTPDTLEPILSPKVDDKSSIEIHSTAFEALGAGEPPAPPGEGSAVLLSEMDFLPASNGGTLAFASRTTLPLATSALRTTTTPLSLAPGYGPSVERPASIAAEDMKHEEVTPALDSLPRQHGSITPS